MNSKSAWCSQRTSLNKPQIEVGLWFDQPSWTDKSDSWDKSEPNHSITLNQGSCHILPFFGDYNLIDLNNAIGDGVLDPSVLAGDKVNFGIQVLEYPECCSDVALTIYQTEPDDLGNSQYVEKDIINFFDEHDFPWWCEIATSTVIEFTFCDGKRE